MGQVLTQWQCMMASRVALDLTYWAMRSALYNLICMAIEMACKAGPIMGNALGTVQPDPHGHRNGLQSRFIFSFVDFMSCITVATQPCYGLLKLKPSYIIVHYYVISLFVYYCGLPTAIDAVLAIIANGGQAIVVIYREAVEIN